jgi:hypothetical protein
VVFDQGSISFSPGGTNVYSYNADGYVVKVMAERSYVSTSFDSLEVSGGNITGGWYKDSDTESYKSYGAFGYDPAHANSLKNENFGEPFLGKSNTNAATASYGETYQNYYDKQDRIIKRIATYSSLPSVTESYTYY